MKAALGTGALVGLCIRKADVATRPMQTIGRVKTQTLGGKIKAIGQGLERHTSCDVLERQAFQFGTELRFGIL